MKVHMKYPSFYKIVYMYFYVLICRLRTVFIYTHTPLFSIYLSTYAPYFDL